MMAGGIKTEYLPELGPAPLIRQGLFRLSLRIP